MDMSIFLAKWLGLFMLIMTILMVFRRNEIERVVGDLFTSPSLLYLAGALNLSMGLFIVIIHPIFALNWQGLITLLGCISIFKGVMRIGFPEQCQKCEKGMMRYYWVMVGVVAVLGAFLTCHGFMISTML